MKYDHVPRPDIEQHPHIRMLIENQEKRTADRTLHRNRDKELAERQEEIDRYKHIDVIEFFCAHCQEDFAHYAVKQVEVDWSNSRQNIAFYKGKHEECGNWAIRHITDRFMDPYWFESIQVANDRGKHYADLLQPFETGYQLLYGRKNT
jgi:hypothetical protein